MNRSAIRHRTLNENDTLSLRRISGQELREAFEIRYEWIVEKLGWLPENDDRLETDDHDSKDETIHLAVYCADDAGTRMLAYLRAISGGLDDFMMGAEFQATIDGMSLGIKKGRALELSRFALNQKELVSQNLRKQCVDLLFEGLSDYCFANNIEQVWMVTIPFIVRMFEKRGFNLRKVYESVEADHARSTVVICLELIDQPEHTFPPKQSYVQ